MTDERSDDLDDLLPDLGVAEVLRQRPAGIGSWRHAVRIALAVTVSWALALAVSHSTFSLFAPVTTLLVVQNSPWTTLGVSIQRIIGTGLGVLLASIYVNLLGLTWWSFLIGVLASLLIARLLPLSVGGQLQIPVAVVFVLALGPGTIQQDAWRVLDVVIGGVVGLAAVFVFPPRPKPTAVEAALRAYRDALVDTVRQISAGTGALPAPLDPGEVHAFVAPSRRLRDVADDARADLVKFAEGSHLNLRAHTVPDDLAGYALRLRRLTGIGVQVRGIVGAVNRTYDRAGITPALPAAQVRTLLDSVADLMESTLGSGHTQVGDTDRATSHRKGAALAGALRTQADAVAEDGVGEVLEAVSLLGRLDHVRMQIVEFPEWEE